MVTTTTDSPTTMPSPVVVTSSKVATKPPVTKAALEGQGKRVYDKGLAKPLVKGKKNVVKTTTNATTTAGPSANTQSNLRDKAKHTATLIQEITKELQAIEEEALKEEEDSDATQESDLEQEDSDNLLTDGEQ